MLPTLEKQTHNGVMHTRVDDCQFVCIAQDEYYRILHQVMKTSICSFKDLKKKFSCFKEKRLCSFLSEIFLLEYQSRNVAFETFDVELKSELRLKPKFCLLFSLLSNISLPLSFLLATLCKGV